MKPKRIQRKRTKGWRMPPNTVYVGRPTLFGNPYRETEAITREKTIEFYKKWIELAFSLVPNLIEDLKGKNLACWCSLDQPCHADVLLEIAN